jgi:adenylate kinase
MINLVLFGPPGAGKGTQATFLSKAYRLIHLSTGDILREEIAAETEIGRMAKDIICRGELVPDSLVIDLIQGKIEKNPESNGFLFDGFPRTVPQAQALDKLLIHYRRSVSAMLSLEVEKEELIERLIIRGNTSGRSDDADRSIIENRIQVYNEKTQPLIKYYKDARKYHAINGVGTVDEITERLKICIDKLPQNKKSR